MVVQGRACAQHSPARRRDLTLVVRPVLVQEMLLYKRCYCTRDAIVQEMLLYKRCYCTRDAIVQEMLCAAAPSPSLSPNGPTPPGWSEPHLTLVVGQVWRRRLLALARLRRRGRGRQARVARLEVLPRSRWHGVRTTLRYAPSEPLAAHRPLPAARLLRAADPAMRAHS